MQAGFSPFRIFDRPTDMPIMKSKFFFALRVVLYFFALPQMCIILFWFSHSGQNFLIIFRYTKVGIFHLTMHSIIQRIIYVWLNLKNSHSEGLTLINGEISENCLGEMQLEKESKRSNPRILTFLKTFKTRELCFKYAFFFFLLPQHWWSFPFQIKCNSYQRGWVSNSRYYESCWRNPPSSHTK